VSLASDCGLLWKVAYEEQRWLMKDVSDSGRIDMREIWVKIWLGLKGNPVMSRMEVQKNMIKKI